MKWFTPRIPGEWHQEKISTKDDTQKSRKTCVIFCWYLARPSVLNDRCTQSKEIVYKKIYTNRRDSRWRWPYRDIGSSTVLLIVPTVVYYLCCQLSCPPYVFVSGNMSLFGMRHFRGNFKDDNLIDGQVFEHCIIKVEIHWFIIVEMFFICKFSNFMGEMQFSMVHKDDDLT